MEPVASRPHMPGYGTLGPDEGSGLLPWSWALERLTGSHDYWLATVSPDGLPHVMPVWAVWLEAALWFSSSHGSRKARNLAERPLAALTTEAPLEPVVAQGPVERVGDAGVASFVDAVNAKYGTAYDLGFFAGSSCFRLTPRVVFGLDSADFTGSPTRWLFDTAAERPGGSH